MINVFFPREEALSGALFLKTLKKQIFKEMLAQISTKISFMDRHAKSYTQNNKLNLLLNHRNNR